MTVNEHLQFIQAMYPHGEFSAEQVVAKLSLSNQLEKVPHTLSKGNKQKLMIATALLRNFDYFVADEPFTGLDPKQISVLKQILMELRQKNKGILLSTHLLDVIELFCDRYIMIDSGSVVAAGSKAEIAKYHGLSPQLTVEKLYISLTDYTGEGLRYDDENCFPVDEG